MLTQLVILTAQDTPSTFVMYRGEIPTRVFDLGSFFVARYRRFQTAELLHDPAE